MDVDNLQILKKIKLAHTQTLNLEIMHVAQ